MWRNRNHCEMRHRWRQLFRRKVQVSSDQIPIFLFHVFVKNDLVHSSCKVQIYFRYFWVKIDLFAKIFVVLNHLTYSPDLLCIQFRYLVGWHIVNEVVISDERISISSLFISISYPLSKNSWILSIEQDINSCQFAALFRTVPYSLELVGNRVIRLNQDSPPIVLSVLVLPQSLSNDKLYHKSDKNGSNFNFKKDMKV